MAVIIKNMEKLPDSCYNCDLHNYHFCDLTKNCVEQNIDNGTRANDCPLKEVTDAIDKENDYCVYCKHKDLTREDIICRHCFIEPCMYEYDENSEG